MKARTKWFLILFALMISGLGWYFLQKAKPIPPEPITSPVEVKDLLETISSTGTIQAKGTVEVGSQVSGTVAKVLADYNDRVKPGQVLVVLDQSTLLASLDEAEAQKAKIEAQIERSKADFDRITKLFNQGHSSEKDLIDARSNYFMDQASLKSAEANLRRSRENLAHATIRSPIRGTVLQRNVEVGQTVAASLSSPTLFVIAEDLSQLEIIAGVDESDISQIHTGQQVRFNVQAYPDSIFAGKVNQIRLLPETVQNVVTYQVVIDAPNPHEILLPGMTATVDFVIQKSEKTLCVPSAALRYHPSLIPREIRENGKKVLWMASKNGPIHPLTVETGITDGNCTEILKPNRLQVGDLVIVGEKKDSTVPRKKQTGFMGFGPPPGGRPH